MLTERGWAILGAGIGLAGLWVLLGEIELLAAGALLLAAVGLGAVVTRTGRPQVSLFRRLTPTMVHDGDRATVDVVIRNLRGRALRNAALVDDVESLGRAEFEIGSLPGLETAQAAYQIVCRPRGVYQVGPARMRALDPLGLAAVEAASDTIDRLIVYPKVEDLSGFPSTRGRDPSSQASRPEFTHRGGEDFYTLREYRTGDDLRFVHWPSSAKRDELVIRQLETPWQSRALVALDTRPIVYQNQACFEKAVQGAASVVRHLSRHGFDADLWAGRVDGVSVSDYTAAMETLAEVDLDPGLDLRAATSRMRRAGQGGALILVSGVPDHDLLEVHRLLGREYRTTIVMSATETSSTNEAAFHRAGALTVSVAPAGSWAQAWAKTVDRTWIGASAG